MTRDDLVLTPCGLRFRGHLFPCSIGRGGRTECKREGDGATPVGVHRLVAMLFRPDRITCPARWAHPIRPGDMWSDDPNDPEYNHPVRFSHHYSRECLWRADPLYDLVLVTDWNRPVAVAGRGSAIFVHQWRRPCFPTEGCVGLARAHLHWIASRLHPGIGLVIVRH